MASWTRIGLSALFIGTTASIVSTAALAIIAKVEGKGALQPTNATSHWLHGDRAAAFAQLDTRHTGLGYATHHASALFWAWPFAAWLASRPRRSSAEMLRDASVMSAIAATGDYGITPKRLTPGWELVLPTRSMFAAFAALAVGLALGARVTQDLLDSRWLLSEFRHLSTEVLEQQLFRPQNPLALSCHIPSDLGFKVHQVDKRINLTAQFVC
jgi:hypothetical protein